MRVSVASQQGWQWPGNRQLRQPGADDPADAERDLQPRPVGGSARDHARHRQCAQFRHRGVPGTAGQLHVTIDTRGTPLDFSDDVVTVADVSPNPVDGVDHLTHIERLQFADQAFVDLVPGLNAEPVGQPTITDENGGDVTVGDFLDVSIAGVTDADGTITGPIRYTWQSEAVRRLRHFRRHHPTAGRRPGL